MTQSEAEENSKQTLTVSDVNWSIIDQVDRKLAEICDMPNTGALTLLKRCTLRPGQITLEFDGDAMAARFEIPKASLKPEILQTALAFTRRKRSVKAKLIIGSDRDNSVASSAAPKDQTLIRNITAANRWYRAIQKGRSFAEIANTEGTSANTVQRVIPLAFLAPDIVRDIFQGKQPVALTSDWLLRQTLPGNFDKQRDLIQTLKKIRRSQIPCAKNAN